MTEEVTELLKLWPQLASSCLLFPPVVAWETYNLAVLGTNSSPSPVFGNRIESSISLKKVFYLGSWSREW